MTIKNMHGQMYYRFIKGENEFVKCQKKGGVNKIKIIVKRVFWVWGIKEIALCDGARREVIIITA